jgi:uncharacterized membrane protein
MLKYGFFNGKNGKNRMSGEQRNGIGGCCFQMDARSFTVMFFYSWNANMSLALALHVLAAVVWVGGMFFALLILRPAAGALEPPERLPLWGRVFDRFFPWVWAAVILLPASGYWMIMKGWGGMAHLPVYLHLMQGAGWLMILVFLHLWFAPYRRLKRAIAAQDYPAGGRELNRIRILVTVNLVLGLLNAAIGASGRYWG